MEITVTIEEARLLRTMIEGAIEQINETPMSAADREECASFVLALKVILGKINIEDQVGAE